MNGLDAVSKVTSAEADQHGAEGWQIIKQVNSSGDRIDHLDAMLHDTWVVAEVIELEVRLPPEGEQRSGATRSPP